ncbi:LmeA family phospholipid-binding protein [Streptomyces sp. NPDC056670]|uniref:LmeA family phospholipid-binding protein n=1 Tax=Streptomyces sp. NPDC056670 TaxID=3345904 RepID=UPI00368D5441
MRTPTRMHPRYRNPYDELAALADPEPDPHPADPSWTDPAHTARETARSPRESAHSTQEMPQAIPGRAPADAPGEPVPGPEAHPFEGTRTGPGDDFFASPRSRRRPGAGRRTRRGRRRRSSLLAAVPRTAKLLVALTVGAGFLVLGDRCAVMYAEKKAQQELQSELHLEAAPQVDIHGFPFLTQVLDKRLQRVDVTVPHVPADRISLAKVRAGAQDIQLTGDLPSDISGAVIGRLNGEITLSFDDMNRELAASQVKFSRRSDNSVGADGKLTIAGQELRVSAEAQLRLVGDHGLSTDIDGMSLDMPGIATYRPGRDRGLTLHRETAELISRDTARAKAMLAVPAVVKRLGVPDKDVSLALHNEEKLHELVGTPRFAEQLTHVNLVDVVVDHPWLLSKVGIDPKLLAGLLAMRPPELSDRLSFSFTLPKQARDLHLRGVRVEKNGIVATASGTGLTIGKGH